MHRLIYAVALLTLSTLLLHILTVFTARREPCARYNAIRVYVLAATWVPARAANAASICATVVAAPRTYANGLKEVTCVVTPGVWGAVATEDDMRAFEAEGLVSFAPLPPPPFWRALVLPRMVSPLLPEFPVNSLADTRNARRRHMVANTIGVLRALQNMARDAAFVDAGSQARTLNVFFEDDADLSAYGSGFAEALLKTSTRLPCAWDMLLLAPPPDLCERAAKLPWPWHVPPGGLIAPRLSLSRTTALVFSPQGVRRVLEQMPATNVIDLWLRALMRAGRLRVRISCGQLVGFTEQAAHQTQ